MAITNLLVIRREFTDMSTIGELFIDGVRECHTLEDRVRDGAKVWGQTAIPPGRYEVVINFSNRFKRRLPLLLNVSGFEGIRIHAGNTATDTHGCLLLGRTKNKNFIGQSRTAFDAFFRKLEAATKRGKVFIEIK